MINTDDFIKRLEQILDYYSLNASTFADKIGVQRSSLSHLLSGRNKPSLDFMLKIIAIFPDVDLYWLLNGNGSFPKSEIVTSINNLPPTHPVNVVVEETKIEIQPDLFSEKSSVLKNQIENTAPNYNAQPLASIKVNDEIDRIVIFYKNGTFKNYVTE